MSKLIQGKIPAFTECPYKNKCSSITTGNCNHTGIMHTKAYSCGFARAFQIFSIPSTKD